MKIPKGFRFSGVAVGLKPQRRDVALVVSDVPAAAAGLFTVNKAAAAPVMDARDRVPAEGMRAVLVNSGNANALTGPRGLEDVANLRGAVADALGVQKRAVLTASTGVIGVRLPAQKILDAHAGPGRAAGRARRLRRRGHHDHRHAAQDGLARGGGGREGRHRVRHRQGLGHAGARSSPP